MGAYDFEENYFHKSKEDNFLCHFGPFAGKKNLNYLELGIYKGQSLIWMLENILTDQTSKAVAIDHFAPRTEAAYYSNLLKSGLTQKVTTFKGYFHEFLPTFKSESFDFIYLDGGHSAWLTLESTVLAWRVLKLDGILLFDDYLWEDRNKIFNGDKLANVAINSFLNCYSRYIEVLSKGYQLSVRKKALTYR